MRFIALSFWYATIASKKPAKFNERLVALRRYTSNTDTGAGATSAPPLRLRQPGPESPEPLALPAHNRVCLDVAQGLAPVAPQIPERNPKHPIQGRQQRALPFSLKRGYLHSERRVLDGHGLMAAEEQSDESKH